MNYRIDVFCVTPETVVVEAITHHEVVGNLLAAVSHIELHLQFAWLEQKGTNVDTLGILLFQRIEHVSHREARIHDIFDNDDRSARNVHIEPNHFANVSRRVSAFVGSQLDEGNLARQVNLPQEVGSKDEGAIEDSEEDRLFALVVAIDFLGHAPYLTLNCSLGDGYRKGFVLYLDDSISLHNYSVYFGLLSVHHGSVSSRGEEEAFAVPTLAPRTRLIVSGVICRKLAMCTIGALRTISGFSRSSLS